MDQGRISRKRSWLCTHTLLLCFKALVLMDFNNCRMAVFAGTDVAGIKLGNISTVMRTGSAVFDITTDLSDSNKLLFADGCSLKSIDGNGQMEILVGSPNRCGYQEGVGQIARLRNLWGVKMLNSSTIVVADSSNHCFRKIDRHALDVTVFAGRCRYFGHKDGMAAEALFNTPRNIISHATAYHKLLTADGGSNAIRSLEITTQTVTTMISGLPAQPYSLTFDNSFQNLIIVSLLKIFTYNLNSGSISLGIPGSLFGDHAILAMRGIIRYQMSVYIVAGRYQVLVMNSEKTDLDYICTGIEGSEDGSVDQCQMSKLHNVFYHCDKLYLGERGRFRTIPVMNQWSDCASSNGVFTRTKQLDDGSTETEECQCSGLCQSMSCLNGGTCRQDRKSCDCVAGYAGHQCETDIDDCLGVTCANGGACLDRINNHICQCQEGYIGHNCETELTEYVALKEEPGNHTVLKQIPVFGVNCCFNWCNRNDHCQAILYKPLEKKCALLSKVCSISLGSGRAPKLQAYAKSDYVKRQWTYSPTNATCIFTNLTRVNYSIGQEFCQSLGGWIVEPNTQASYEWLKTHLLATQELSSKFWTGAVYKEEQEKYTWSSNSQEVSGYNDWAEQSPSSSQKDKPHVTLQGLHQFGWSNAQANHMHMIICQIQL